MKAGTLARLAVVAGLSLGGCRETPDVPPGSGTRVDPASVAGRFTLEMWQLRSGIRLGDWASANLGDRIERPDSVAGAPVDGWCARGVSIAELRGKAIRREVYFFPPAPDSTLSLPDTGAVDMALGCTLGVMLLSAPSRDTTTKGSEEADTLAALLAVPFGEPTRSAPGFGGSAFWARTARFERNGVVIFSGYQARHAVMDSAGRLLALAFLPEAGFATDGSQIAERFYTPTDSVPLDSVLRIAALDSALADSLRALAVRRADTVTAPHENLTGPLSRWIAAAQDLPARRRAAALYAADVVLSGSMCAHRLCTERVGPALNTLRRAGAEFTWSELGGSLIYHRNWMSRARILDRDSPLGERILIAQLAGAFDFSGVCEGGADGFRRVIREGERYLERLPGSPIAADVHYLIAEAYRDIVALAGGAGSDYADTADYLDEASGARAAALDHYRAVISEGSGELARQAWRRAWWLLSGLPVTDTRFFCIYD